MADNSLYSANKLPIIGANIGVTAVKRPTTTSIPTNVPTSVPTTNPKVTTVNTSGGKPTGGTGGGTKTTTSPDISGYLGTLADQRKRAAEDAYNQGMQKLNDIYGRQAGNFANIYNSGAGQIDNSYNNSLGKINQSAEKAMQEAYVNRMMSEKNLSQKLAAQGLSGGASESAMAGLINNYGNARNNIQTTWNGDLSDLEMQRQNNLADLYNAYQTNLANLEANRGNAELALLNNLNNQVASIDDSLFDALMKNPTALTKAASTATSNMKAYTPSEQTATNTNNTVNTQQSNDAGQATQAARLAALEEMQNALRNRISSNPNMTAQQATNWLTGLYGSGNAGPYADVMNKLQALGYSFG